MRVPMVANKTAELKTCFNSCSVINFESLGHILLSSVGYARDHRMGSVAKGPFLQSCGGWVAPREGTISIKALKLWNSLPPGD